MGLSTEMTIVAPHAGPTDPMHRIAPRELRAATRIGVDAMIAAVLDAARW